MKLLSLGQRGSIKCCIWEFQTASFHTGTYTGATQETSEWFSWQKQLNNLKTFTLGCLQDDPSQNQIKPIGLFIFLQQGLDQALGDLLDLLFLAEAQFGNNTGAILGFLCEAGAGPPHVQMPSLQYQLSAALSATQEWK